MLPPGRARGLALAAAILAGLLAVVLVARSGSPHPGAPGKVPFPLLATTPPTTGQPLSPLGPPGMRAPSSTVLGVNVGAVFNPRIFSRAEREQQLTAMAAHGVHEARGDAFWQSTEPVAPAGPGAPHVYTWTRLDGIAADLARHGLRWAPILDYSAAWASSFPFLLHGPPRDPDDFAAYAGAFARRYGPDGDFWRAHPELPALPVLTYEIWNEEDSAEFWQLAPEPGRYLELYLRARNAIKASDPEARVIIGGLSHGGAFLRALLEGRRGVVGHIDGVGLHPYAPTPADVVRRVRSTRAILDELGGAGIALHLTEVGWVTSPRSSHIYAPPPREARYLSETLRALDGSPDRVASAFVYAWVTAEQSPAAPADWYGIYRRNGTGTPASDALGAVLSARR